MVLLRLTDVRPDAEIAKLLDSTVRDAEVEWKPLVYEGQYPTTGFGITELRPLHVVATRDATGFLLFMSSISWGASITTASTYFEWINLTLTDQAYVMPTGVFNLESTPKVTEMKPSANGLDMPVVNLEQLYALDLARVWFEKPFAARPNNNFKNELVARTTGTERIGLLGYCIAKRSYLITK